MPRSLGLAPVKIRSSTIMSCPFVRILKSTSPLTALIFLVLGAVELQRVMLLSKYTYPVTNLLQKCLFQYARPFI